MVCDSVFLFAGLSRPKGLMVRNLLISFDKVTYGMPTSNPDQSFYEGDILGSILRNIS